MVLNAKVWHTQLESLIHGITDPHALLAALVSDKHNLGFGHPRFENETGITAGMILIPGPRNLLGIIIELPNDHVVQLLTA